MSLEADNSDSAFRAAGVPAAGARRYRYSSEPAAPVAAAAPTLSEGGAGEIDWAKIWWVLGAGAVCFYFFYALDLQHLANRWTSDAGWSHGWVVPLISLFFIRLKWDTLSALVPQGSWAGLPVLVIGVIAQILFRATGLPYMSPLSIMVILFGATVFVFGWEYLKILWLPIAYLGFSVPPPAPLYVAMTTPMQAVAAELGVLMMPLFGGEGTRSATVIDVVFGGKHIPLNVAEACSGMRMLVAFFALAVALAYSTSRPVWQKLTLAACALPIAILCNGMRVTLTGVMAAKLGGEYAEGKAHEYLGLVMLGPAMLLQLGLGWILDRLFIDVPDDVGGAA